MCLGFGAVSGEVPWVVAVVTNHMSWVSSGGSEVV